MLTRGVAYVSMQFNSQVTKTGTHTSQNLRVGSMPDADNSMDQFFMRARSFNLTLLRYRVFLYMNKSQCHSRPIPRHFSQLSEILTANDPPIFIDSVRQVIATAIF